MDRVVVFGVGDVAQLVRYYFSKDTNYKIVAFTLDREYIKQKTFMNLPVIDFSNIERKYSPRSYKMFIAVGYSKVNSLRADKYYKAREKGYNLVSYISPRATIFDNVEIGDNCLILEDNTLQPFVKIGNNVTLWSGNHIGHHSEINDHCFITSHVVISGGVKIGPFTFIGVNATIRDRVSIARKCIIGAGALILKDTSEREVYSALSAELSNVPSNRVRGI